MGGTIPSQASVFTTLRWENGRVAWLPEHLRRLQEHAQRLGIAVAEKFHQRLNSTPIHGEGNLYANSIGS